MRGPGDPPISPIAQMDGGSPGVGSSWHPSPLGCSTDFTDSTDPIQEGEPQISPIAQMDGD
jgi:hypothetical protein